MPQSVARIPKHLLLDDASTQTESALIHSYPGSMPPFLASRLTERYSSPNELVFDPFCGIGTVPLEALRLGRKAVGTDLLPLAVEVTNVAATLPSVPALLASWSQVKEAHYAQATQFTSGISNEFLCPPKQVEALRKWFHPQTFHDIANLANAIYSISDFASQRVFRLVLASSLVSLSRRISRGVLHWGWIADNVIPVRSDLQTTNPMAEVSSRLDKLFAFMRGVNRGGSLATREVAFEHNWLFQGQPTANVPNHVDLLFTSPPYPYSIDYALSTRLSGYLLDLPFNDLRRHEIGARYKRKRKHKGTEYSAQIATALSMIGATVSPGGIAVLVLPDPEEYTSIVPFSEAEWISFIGHSLGGSWKLIESGVRVYAARRVVHSSRPERHDLILVFSKL